MIVLPLSKNQEKMYIFLTQSPTKINIMKVESDDHRDVDPMQKILN